MSFPQEIQDALQVYDKNKGFWRRLFRRDQAAIRALRTLSEAEQTNLLKIYQCFIGNLPKPTQASYQVYQAVLNYFTQIGFSGIPNTMDQLYTVKLLNPKNLEKLTQLKASQFQTLARTLEQLSSQQLLTQGNFDAIANHFEIRTEEGIPIEFNGMATATDRLSNYNCLNQDNFNYILENPHHAVHIASVLTILSETDLMTFDNLSKLYHPDNQFLLSDDADLILWSKFKGYLNKLLIPKTNQEIFDKLIELAKQEDPKDKINSYMDHLNSPFNLDKKNLPFKFPTLPKSASQELLNEESQLAKSGTW